MNIGFSAFEEGGCDDDVFQENPDLDYIDDDDYCGFCDCAYCCPPLPSIEQIARYEAQLEALELSDELDEAASRRAAQSARRRQRQKSGRRKPLAEE